MEGWHAVPTPTMNLADPELELLDPTPNVHAMFLHFDKTFFWSQLSSRCVVRWSKRMFSSAGMCSYEGRGGLCDIALSEPLLKLRPRKDLVETLLHEMIHAYLFVTSRVQDRDGHGPNFQAHMYRINRAAGLNISIYHNFHDEVKLYQTHWWRCNGLCQMYRPHFGIVRRSNNRAPGPNDYWWEYHRRTCGGTFIKIKEPDKPKAKGKTTNITTPNADITKYFNNNNNNNTSNQNIIQNNKPVLKDASNVIGNVKVGIKTNTNGTLVVAKKNIIFNPQVPKSSPVVFTGKGKTIGSKQPNDVVETVRNIWVNKQIGINNTPSGGNNSSIVSNPNKHKPEYKTDLPPPKVKKIDEYFKTTATSVLKDVYGQDFKITQTETDQKFKAIPTKTNLVDCPVCNSKIDTTEINRHLDECLNKDVIEKLSKENVLDTPVVVENVVHVNNTDFKEKDKNTSNNVVNRPGTNNDVINLIDTEFLIDVKCKKNEQRNKRWDQNNGNRRQSDSFPGPNDSNMVQKPPISVNPSVPTEPSCSYTEIKQEAVCPCCGDKLNKSVNEHLDECLSFFRNNTTAPVEKTIVVLDDIDEEFDDEFDDTDEFNKTGTKLPCPCCLVMVERRDMSQHLRDCLVKNY